jgi:hypothetical protein
VARGEDLGDGTAGVVADQVDGAEPERVAEVFDDRRQAGDR